MAAVRYLVPEKLVLLMFMNVNFSGVESSVLCWRRKVAHWSSLHGGETAADALIRLGQSASGEQEEVKTCQGKETNYK